MTEKTGMFARMMASTSLGAPKPMGGAAPAAAAPAPAAGTEESGGGAAGLTEAQVEPMLVAAKAEGHADGLAAGATAERERTSAVFASEAGQANMPMAAWMLESSPNATAEAIIGKLATMPKAAPVATTAAPAAPAAVTTPLSKTPAADLGGSGTANDGNAGAPTADDVDKSWDAVLTDTAASGGFGVGVRLGGNLAAAAKSDRPRTGH